MNERTTIKVLVLGAGFGGSSSRQPCPKRSATTRAFAERDIEFRPNTLVRRWIPVNPLTLETAFEGVYAVGDVTSVVTPKAGVFAEGQASVAAAAIIAAASRQAPTVV